MLVVSETLIPRRWCLHLANKNTTTPNHPLRAPVSVVYFVFSFARWRQHRVLANVMPSPVARPSVCRLSVCRLSSVHAVHPTQAIEIFGNFSTPFGMMAIY